jgi:hypothetical protein
MPRCRTGRSLLGEAIARDGWRVVQPDDREVAIPIVPAAACRAWKRSSATAVLSALSRTADGVGSGARRLGKQVSAEERLRTGITVT